VIAWYPTVCDCLCRRASLARLPASSLALTGCCHHRTTCKQRTAHTSCYFTMLTLARSCHMAPRFCVTLSGPAGLSLSATLCRYERCTIVVLELLVFACCSSFLYEKGLALPQAWTTGDVSPPGPSRQSSSRAAAPVLLVQAHIPLYVIVCEVQSAPLDLFRCVKTVVVIMMLRVHCAARRVFGRRARMAWTSTAWIDHRMG
jgi:hypothetical protein